MTGYDEFMTSWLGVSATTFGVKPEKDRHALLNQIIGSTHTVRFYVKNSSTNYPKFILKEIVSE